MQKAEELGLQHFSTGEGAERHLTVEKPSPVSNTPSAAKAKVEPEPEHASSVLPPASKSVGAKPKKKAPKAKPSKAEEDFDTVVETFRKEATHCAFGRCERPIALMGQRCQFCAKVFCLNHAMAEVHGCGDAVRAHARAQNKKAPIVKHSNDEERRKRLEEKLEKKIGGMQEARSAKPKK